MCKIHMHNLQLLLACGSFFFMLFLHQRFELNEQIPYIFQRFFLHFCVFANPFVCSSYRLIQGNGLKAKNKHKNLNGPSRQLKHMHTRHTQTTKNIE